MKYLDKDIFKTHLETVAEFDSNSNKPIANNFATNKIMNLIPANALQFGSVSIDWRTKKSCTIYFSTPFIKKPIVVISESYPVAERKLYLYYQTTMIKEVTNEYMTLVVFIDSKPAGTVTNSTFTSKPAYFSPVTDINYIIISQD